MTKLHEFAFRELYEEIQSLDQKSKDIRKKRAKLIAESWISIQAYNYRVRTK